jgi:hypothetical protein
LFPVSLPKTSLQTNLYRDSEGVQIMLKIACIGSSNIINIHPMIKSFLFSLFCLLTLIISSCNVKPKPAPIPVLPEQPPITNQAPKPSGTMTNQAMEEISTEPINENNTIESKKLLGYVQSAIIPIYKDWVVFENGTYVIFDNIDTIPDIQKAALEHLKAYTPRTVLDSNWDFTISDLDETDGWSVYGNGYGIYTFVHATELSMGASPLQVGAYAKTKRALDEKNPKILFISSQHGIQEVH